MTRPFISAFVLILGLTAVARGQLRDASAGRESQVDGVQRDGLVFAPR